MTLSSSEQHSNKSPLRKSSARVNIKNILSLPQLNDPFTCVNEESNPQQHGNMNTNTNASMLTHTQPRPKPLPMTLNMKIGEELNEIKNTLNDLKFRSKNNNQALVTLNDNLNKFNNHFQHNDQEGNLDMTKITVHHQSAAMSRGGSSSYESAFGGDVGVLSKLDGLEVGLKGVADKLSVLGVESKTSLIKLQQLAEDNDCGGGDVSMYQSGVKQENGAGINERLKCDVDEIKQSLNNVLSQLSLVKCSSTCGGDLDEDRISELLQLNADKITSAIKSQVQTNDLSRGSSSSSRDKKIDELKSFQESRLNALLDSIGDLKKQEQEQEAVKDNGYGTIKEYLEKYQNDQLVNIEGLEKKLESLEDSISASKALFEEESKGRKEAAKVETQERDGLKAELANLKQLLVEKDIELDQVKRENEKLKQESKHLKNVEESSKLELENQLQELKLYKDKMEKQVLDTKTSNIEIQQERDSLKEQLNTTKSKANELENSNQQLKKQVVYESDLSSIKQKVQNQLKNFKTIKNQYQHLIMCKENLINELAYLREVEQLKLKQEIEKSLKEAISSNSRSPLSLIGKEELMSEMVKGMGVLGPETSDGDGAETNDSDKENRFGSVSGLGFNGGRGGITGLGKRNITSRI